MERFDNGDSVDKSLHDRDSNARKKIVYLNLLNYFKSCGFK